MNCACAICMGETGGLHGEAVNIDVIIYLCCEGDEGSQYFMTGIVIPV